MTTDRELLELAAMAVGLEIHAEWQAQRDAIMGRDVAGLWIRNGSTRWNPLTDDGDALRLAVKLNIPIFPYDDETSTGTIGVVAMNFGSKEANTRRAIVRAAAEIGKAMP
jgi:hypothetical protein